MEPSYWVFAWVRIQHIYQTNPKEWDFWMNKQGWGAVLDYIGVDWGIQEDMMEEVDKQMDLREEGV